MLKLQPIRSTLSCGLLLLLIVSCAGAPSPVKYYKISGFAEGTTYSITYGDSLAREFKPQIDSILAAFEKSLSNYDSLSLLSYVNRGMDTVVNQWFADCFAVSKEVHRNSDGLFDPTLNPLIAAYGFGRKKEAGHVLLTQKQIDSIKQFVGFDNVTIENHRIVKSDPRIQLDFNAIAKGQSSDIVAAWLEQQGIQNYVVEIGGEIFARGVNADGGKWRIGIDRPEEGNFTPGAELQTVIELQDKGLATSGNYRKFFTDQTGEKLTHTIDPRSGRPAHHNLLSVTIIAPTTALADGYATACMVGGLEWSKQFLARHPELKGYLIYAQGEQMAVAEF